MRLSLVLLGITLPAVLCSLDRKRSHQLISRNPTGDFTSVYGASNYQNGSTAPGASTGDAGNQQVVVGGDGSNDDSQRPGCTTIFINTAAVSGSSDAGWQETPQVVGFHVDRNLTYGSVTMPLYVETGKDLTAIKRVIIAQPGQPRDSWKYVQLFRNSLLCAVANTSMAVTFGDVLVVAPIWLGASDVKAGAGQASDVFFGDLSWSTGSTSQGPEDTNMSTFKVMDDIISRFANITEYPAVTSIIVAGHSLGGSFSQRYAMGRKDDASTEDLVQYWVGNPGAYVWPDTTRPVTPSNTTCAATIDNWAYGIGGDLPVYFRDDVSGNVTGIYNRYRSRKIQYALGLLDDGAGDTHCEAQYQGSSHLNRGQNMQAALTAMAGGLPATQNFNYVPNTSHEDYLMMSDPNSQEYLFTTGLDAARPSGTTSTGTSTSSNKKGGSGGGSSSSSSSSKSSASSQSSTSNGGNSGNPSSSSSSSSNHALPSSFTAVLSMVVASLALVATILLA